MTKHTCTIRVHPKHLCGEPAVHSFTTSRGETFHECAEHSTAHIVAPVPVERPTHFTTRTGRRVSLGSTQRAFVLIDVQRERVVGRSDSIETLRARRRREHSGRGCFLIVSTETGEQVTR